MAPAMPPHSKFTWVFKTKTSGLSKQGLPSRVGAWASPTLFKVPKVKNEKPERKKFIFNGNITSTTNCIDVIGTIQPKNELF